MKSKDKTILIVDDTPANVALLSNLLKQSYKTKVATNGKKAISIATEKPYPDLVLLDIMMPEMDGYEVCTILKNNNDTKDIPVIFITAMSATEDETKGLSHGAVDYIKKPFIPAVVLSRVKTHLQLKEAQDFLSKQNDILEEKVQIRTEQLGELQNVAMVAMGALAETRDPETGNHINRTQIYVKLLARKLSENPKYSSFFTNEIIEILFKSAPLHDIGKVGIPDHILLKPGKLTEEEFEEMKKHCVIGRDAIAAAESSLSSTDSSFLRYAKEIACYHQEKWDGSGYPEGLSGENIPVSARLMAIADVYDALISRRVYKPPFSQEKTLGIMKEGRGSHFDPDFLDAFLEITDDFYKIAQQYTD